MVGSDVRDVCCRLDRLEPRVGLVLIAMGVAAAILLRIGAAHEVLLLCAALDRGHLTAAVARAPDHPLIHRRLGLLSLYDPAGLDADRAVDHFRRAAQANPFDFESWILLAQAYETVGQRAAAERAYLKALDRAPRYFSPHWLYANFLLREGAFAGALAEFRQAVTLHPPAAESVAEMIWQARPHPVADLLGFADELSSAEAQERILAFLVARGHAREALPLWERLIASSTAGDQTTPSLVSGLMREGASRSAAIVWQAWMKRKGYLLSESDASFWNGGFEHDRVVRPGETTDGDEPGFEWSITSTPEVNGDIVETDAFEGRRALELTFLAHEQVNFAGVSHYLALSPATPYALRFRYRTRGMTAPTGLVVEITEQPSEGTVVLLAQSESLSPSADWREVTIPFTTPPRSEIVLLRIARRPVRPLYDFITGRVWFDGFTLEPVTKASASASTEREPTQRSWNRNE